MGYWELLAIAVGLSMDAFAVAVGKGLASGGTKTGKAVLVGLYFGGFQALMPAIGYLLGSQFGSLIVDFDHWIAFGLLALIGAKMIWESRDCEKEADGSCGLRAMLPLAVATSIDALAVGVSLAFLRASIVPAISLIGFVTFVLSFVGYRLGGMFGARRRSQAELVGGLILIAIGVKILAEHLLAAG